MSQDRDISAPSPPAAPRGARRTRFIHKYAAYIAVVPVLLVAFGFYFGSTVWSMVMSLTASRVFPDLTFVGFRQYVRLFHDDVWVLSLQNLLIFVLGSVGSLVLGFLLAVLLDGKTMGERVFRTIYLYPLAISLIITGLVWQWLFNPSMGLQQFFRDLGLKDFDFNWVGSKSKVMYAIIMAAVWQSAGFYMVLSSSGIKGIDSEIWQASRVDGIPKLRMYVEVIIPMMKFTFLTAFVLLSIGAVKAYDIIVAMTNGGPGGHSELPSYYIVDMYMYRHNIAVGASGSTILLLLVAACMLPFGIVNLVLRRRR
ncbi:MAG TPA: sugar ABC transporter permease [Spirochaetia bacterium]|nr:sugar ABC transporter permease [Spirochaetia bacterium]